MEDARSTVLERIAEPDRVRLHRSAVRRTLRPGDTLAFAGETPRRVHVVSSGLLKLVGRDFDGAETILGLCVPGDVAGILAALDGRALPCDYVAASVCEVVGLDAALFAEVLARNPGAAIALAKALGSQVRWLCDTALERTSAHVPARLAGRLLDLADLLGRQHGDGIDVDLPFPQRDLGGLAGMCRESACKTLRRWKSQGTVSYEGRRLRILRPDVLYRIRCAGRGAEPSP